jgi:hypothetical protein
MSKKKQKTKNKSSMLDQTSSVSKKKVNFKKVLGIILMFIGGLLIFTTLLAWISTFSQPFITLKNSPIPVLEDVPTDSKYKKVILNGHVDKSVKFVNLYVNDEWIKEAIPVYDGSFAYIYEFADEGNYKFEVVSIKGVLFRSKSLKSPAHTVHVDWSAPDKDSLNVTYPDAVRGFYFELLGQAEPGVSIALRNSDGEIVVNTVADVDSGVFTLKGVPLKSGSNVFDLILTDDAGNKTVVEGIISVVGNSPTATDGSIDDGSSENLPESAGDLADAMHNLLTNRLALFVGVIGWIVALTASVYLKKSELF